jgi:Resolvase, N terminal domain
VAVERISGQGCVSPVATEAVRVAQYIRKSTDHHKYSTENHSASIHEYAARRAMQIVRTYADEGISGVTFRKREALQQLIDDVVSKKADFSAILVYDLSRWSRAQDVDEAAYYKYFCKRAGIAVHYCAEPCGSTFENRSNLAAKFLTVIQRKYEGSRLGRQELYADLLEDTEGALRKRALIDALRVKLVDVPSIERIVVAIDPNASSQEDSNECGIICRGASHGRGGAGFCYPMPASFNTSLDFGLNY